MKSVSLIERLSPNFDDRASPIDTIVLHYTGMETAAGALQRLTDPEAKVSAHYLLDEDGSIFSLIPESKRAWHAGVSSWKGEGDINGRSIGVEIVNPGHEFGYRAFPSKQIDLLIALLREIVDRHSIPVARVLGHADVAPQRKEDPGELFPWDRLAQHGLAVGPYEGKPDDGSISYEVALKMLREIGYDAPERAHAAALVAFQRRFCPKALAQGFNPLTKAALVWALDRMR